MQGIITFITTGHIGTFDALFWAWAISIVVAFILLFIPEPATTAISIPLFGFNIFLLALLMVRGVSQAMMGIWSVVTHPFTLSFAGAIIILGIAKAIQRAIDKK